VVGSAVYAGHWMKSGRRFIHDHLVQLRAKPLWLFGSGPLGSHAGPDAVDHPEEIGTLAGAREHHVFTGRLFRHELGRLERIAAAAVHAPEGDFRDWADVDAWADHIDAELGELALTSH
jgi:menaquinone-dependent protoporphyrinogen oxidase